MKDCEPVHEPPLCGPPLWEYTWLTRDGKGRARELEKSMNIEEREEEEPGERGIGKKKERWKLSSGREAVG